VFAGKDKDLAAKGVQRMLAALKAATDALQ
jgi:hypothetical protein